MFDAIAKPFGMLMMWLYEFVGNYGFALILFSLIVKLVLLPFQMKSKRGMMQTTRLQPRLKELERKHGANKQKYNEEVQKLYREENVKPLSGCLWSLIPFPIMLALYSAVRQPLTMMMGLSSGGLAALSEKLATIPGYTAVGGAYEQIAQSKFITEHFNQFAALTGEVADKLRQINYNFLGLDLSRQPQWNFFWTTNWSDSKVWAPGLFLFLIPILSGVLTLFTSKITTKLSAPPPDTVPAKDAPAAPDPQQGQMKMMTYMMPLVSVYFSFVMPASIGVYWVAGSLFGLIQELWLTKRYTRILDAEDSVKRKERRAKELELEEKRRETERKRAENSTELNPSTSKDRRKNIEKSEQQKRFTQWEEKVKPRDEEASREGERRFARGRAYIPERFEGEGAALNGEVLGEDAEYAPEAEDFSDKEE